MLVVTKHPQCPGRLCQNVLMLVFIDTDPLTASAWGYVKHKKINNLTFQYMNQYGMNRFAPYWTGTPVQNNYLFFWGFFWVIFGHLREHRFGTGWTGSRRNKGMDLFNFFSRPLFFASEFCLKECPVRVSIIKKWKASTVFQVVIVIMERLTCFNDVTWNCLNVC